MLKSHIKNVLEEKMRYQCELCSNHKKPFDLKKHVQLVHENTIYEWLRLEKTVVSGEKKPQAKAKVHCVKDDLWHVMELEKKWLNRRC